MIINKDLFDKSRSDMSNPEYIEKLLNMFAGEVKLTTMTDKEMYELRRGHMDILFHITGSIIAHEFAHMVDCHKSRVVKKDFGFKHLGMSRKNRAKDNFAIISTEIRVFAIENIINTNTIHRWDNPSPGDYFHGSRVAEIIRKHGIENRFAKKFFLNESFSLVNSMPEKFKTDEDVILWGTNLYNRTQKEFSNLDVIEDNIKKKMELINNQYCLIWKPV